MTIEIKYKPGTQTWALRDGKPEKLTIKEAKAYLRAKSEYCDKPTPTIRYEITDGGKSYEVSEDEMCDSRQELIKRIDKEEPFVVLK